MFWRRRVGETSNCPVGIRALGVTNADWRDETVSAPMKGLDEARRLRRIAERCPQLVHGTIQTAIEIDECMVGPEGVAQVFSGHDLTAMLQ